MAPESMAGDVSTLPLPGAAAARRSALGRWRARARGGELAAADTVGILALCAIVALSLLVVLVAANRPSILTPTSHTGFFPRWMAGPLGGLLQGFTNDGNTLKWLFTGAVAVMYAAYLLAIKRAHQLPVRWVVAAILAVQAVFLLSPPLALTDLFNYVNYARMEVVHGLNPYTTIPVLEPHNDPSYALSNWHELLSPYGPLFTLVTFAVVPLGVAGSFWALKVILMVINLAIVALVWRCARLLGRDPLPAVVLAGLNPIVLVWGLGGDHNDFLMMFCIIFGFYLLLRSQARAGGQGATGADGGQGATGADGGQGATGAGGGQGATGAGGRPADPRMDSPTRLGTRVGSWLLPLSALDMGAGAAFVTATALKASAAVLIPVMLAGLLRAPRRLVQAVLGMVVAGGVLAGASLVAFGLHIPDLSTQGSLVTSESIPNLIGLALGLGGESKGLRYVMDLALALALLGCCLMAFGRRGKGAQAYGTRRQDGGGRGERAITASGWASVALLVTLSWVLPWYVVWALPLAALSSSRRLRTVTLVFGVYLIVVWVPVSGLLWSALDFHPERTPLGRLHQRYVKELLN